MRPLFDLQAPGRAPRPAGPPGGVAAVMLLEDARSR